MYENWTPNAFLVHMLAVRAAICDGQPAVTPTHLLRAIGIVNPDVEQLLLQRAIDLGPTDWESQVVEVVSYDLFPLTAATVQIMELAEQLRDRLGHPYVHTAHLFLVMVASPDGVTLNKFKSLKPDSVLIFGWLQNSLQTVEEPQMEWLSRESKIQMVMRGAQLLPDWQDTLADTLQGSLNQDEISSYAAEVKSRLAKAKIGQ